MSNDPLLPARKVEYADTEITTTVRVRRRHWEARQVLRSELTNLARCARRSSKDERFFGLFAGAAIALVLGALVPGADIWWRGLQIAMAVFTGLVSFYLHQRMESVEQEADRILHEIEEEQDNRPPSY